MTLANRLKEEGMQEGKLEGRLEGKEEGRVQALKDAVLRALEIRHGGYPEGICEAVETGNDAADLQRLFENALRASSLGELAHTL